MADPLPRSDESSLHRGDRDRAQPGDASRRTAAIMEAIVRVAPIGLGLVIDRVIQWCNETLTRMVGYSAAELQDQSARILYPSDEEFDRVAQIKYSQIRETGTGEVETVWKHKDGQLIRISLRSMAINPADLGEGVVFTAIDISSKKAAEEALRASEEKYRTLVEESRDPIYITAIDGRLLEANPAMQDLLGYSAEELRELNVHQTYAELSERRRFAEEISRQGFVRDYELRLKRKDGQLIDCIITAVAKRSADGSIRQYRGIIRDVTEKKRLEEQYRQSQKMEAIGRLAGGVAHDFNNLLTVISGHTEMALLTSQPGLTPHEDLKEIQTASARAANLVKQLLAFSRKQPSQPKILDLNELLSNTQKMLARIIGADIELVTAPDPGLKRIKADPSQMEQVLFNLAINARDAMPSGGRLTIATANLSLPTVDPVHFPGVPAGRYVALTIADTGHGMPPEVKGRLFEPFFTTKDSGKGTGLGLSTIYGIIRQTNGFIQVESELGQGSTFRVLLPAVPVEAERREPVEEIGYLPHGHEPILVVEDDDAVRRLAVKVLERLGYQLTQARDGEAALGMCHQPEAPFRLLVTDVVMPRMSGVQLAGRLRQQWPGLKVLFISGYSPELISQLDSGADSPEYLQKPFRPADLARKVREVLDK